MPEMALPENLTATSLQIYIRILLAHTPQIFIRAKSQCQLKIRKAPIGSSFQ